MRLKYTGDFKDLKNYGYKLEEKGLFYYKDIFIGQRGNKTSINTIFIIAKTFKTIALMSEEKSQIYVEREIFNIMLKCKIVNMSLQSVDIQDLILDGLVKIDDN